MKQSFDKLREIKYVKIKYMNQLTFMSSKVIK